MIQGVFIQELTVPVPFNNVTIANNNFSGMNIME